MESIEKFFLIIRIGDFFHLEKAQISMSSPQVGLKCGGRACPKCGKCCDWYIDNGGWKHRGDGTCTYYGPHYVCADGSRYAGDPEIVCRRTHSDGGITGPVASDLCNCK